MKDRHLKSYSEHVLFPPQCTQLYEVRVDREVHTGWLDKNKEWHEVKRETSNEYLKRLVSEGLLVL